MQDIVVLLPGITGSVLQHNQDEIWSDSISGYFNAFSSLGGSLQRLILREDGNGDDDGIRAVRLIAGAQIIPGLVKIDGYSGISQMIRDSFEIIDCLGDRKALCNYYEFAYDWRRDIRVAAQRLSDSLNDRLLTWRRHHGTQAPKTILIGHSMGGLVARYYLEVLGGWRDCRSLITFGSPFQGSLNALNYLTRGYKQSVFDLTDVLRSCTSVYQLLPTYDVVRKNGSYVNLSVLENVHGLDSTKVRSALRFHSEIDQAIQSNRLLDEYRNQAYSHVAVIGTSQETLQSAIVTAGDLNVTDECPDWIDSLLSDGDGTVPRYSAVAQMASSIFVPERHSALQNNPFVLNELRERLKQLQSRGAAPIRGTDTRECAKTVLPGITLVLQDQYPRDVPVQIRANLTKENSIASSLHFRIEGTDKGGFELTGSMIAGNEGQWRLPPNALPPGNYRVRVEAIGVGALTSAVTDLFQVT